MVAIIQLYRGQCRLLIGVAHQPFDQTLNFAGCRGWSFLAFLLVPIGFAFASALFLWFNVLVYSRPKSVEGKSLEGTGNPLSHLPRRMPRGYVDQRED